MNEKTKSTWAIIVLIIAFFTGVAIIADVLLLLLGMVYTAYGSWGLLWLLIGLLLLALMAYGITKLVIWAMDTVGIDD